MHGRVLIIDCYSRDHSDDGKRKTESYEFNSEAELREFYVSGAGKGEGNHVLRIIHVQNAQWARDFLLRKFNIKNRQDITGTAFERWAVYDRPQKRGGKPVLNARSFRTSRDPWRGVSRTGFGFDYLKYYRSHVIPEDEEERDWKLMELQFWNDDNNPAHGYDVYVQRLSVYVQRNEGPVNLSPDEDMKNPYLHDGRNGSLPYHRGEGNALPLMESMDNGSTIILFEASQSHACEDTLIQARQEIEIRWRRLMHLLPREEIASESLLSVELMNIVLRDLFKAIHQNWSKTVSKCDEHVSILEDKIYDNPADESRAPELWTNQSLWLKVEKLVSLQVSVLQEIQNNVKEMSDEDQPHDEWFKHSPEEMKGIETMVQEQLVKPTANLSDLMYKSVGIRDARHSLQLGLSVWRLSWITFIFLPLTFMVGFFGMNVGIFQPDDGYPDIKWYFIASVPLMVLVVLFYFIFKRADPNAQHNPVERGAYEHIYHDFAIAHPSLWSRVTGPRVDSVRPRGWWSSLKWKLITRWFDPTRTIAARPMSDIDEMSWVAKLKRRVAMKWLDSLRTRSSDGPTLNTAEYGMVDWTGQPTTYSPFEELVATSMPVAIADADPIVAAKLARRFMPRRSRSSSRGRSTLNRPVSGPSDGVMIDEERSDDDGAGEDSDSSESPGGSSIRKTRSQPAVRIVQTRHAYEDRSTPPSDSPGKGKKPKQVPAVATKEVRTGDPIIAASEPDAVAGQVEVTSDEKRGRSPSFRGLLRPLQPRKSGTPPLNPPRQ